MTKKYNIAVVGATTNIGLETLSVLAERNFPINTVYAAGASDEIGKEVSFGDEILKMTNIADLDFSKVNIAFFCSSSDISKQYAAKAAAKGCIVIDKSTVFSGDANVPVIVPEANVAMLSNYQKKNMVITPTSCCVALAAALKPLDNAAKLKRVVVSTYQSTSGVGKEAMDELYHQTKSKYSFNDYDSKALPKQIAFNLFPQIGAFGSDNLTEEERRIESEFVRVVGDHAKISVTCVRVPVFLGHSMSVNVEFEKEMDAAEARQILKESESIDLVENNHEYITPIEVAGEDQVYVCRVRDDASKKNSINLWITFDNIRKGTAINSVKIAEEITYTR
jgi:aspartate-semialdehyde dehydrogenase